MGNVYGAVSDERMTGSIPHRPLQQDGGDMCLARDHEVWYLASCWSVIYDVEVSRFPCESPFLWSERPRWEDRDLPPALVHSVVRKGTDVLLEVDRLRHWSHPQQSMHPGEERCSKRSIDRGERGLGALYIDRAVNEETVSARSKRRPFMCSP